MGTSYYIAFNEEIDPDYCERLQTMINKNHWNTFFGIEHHEDKVYIDCCVEDYMSYTASSKLEVFIKTDISKALVKTILVTEECDGDQTTFAIGPDVENVESQHALDQIQQVLMPQLTEGHKLLLQAHLRDN